jgi:PKD repeat protein
VVKAGGSRTGFTGGAHDALLFDASASSDPDGDPLQFVWDFGDGTKASGEKVFHLFERPGNYRVTLTANDNKGSACSRSSEAVDVVIKARD